jgi:type IV pilus assembly protein PilN
MRLDINLASRPYQNLRNFWMRWIVGLAALTLVTILIIGYTVLGLLQAHRERVAIEAIQNNIAALNEKEISAKAFLNQPDNRNTRDRSQYLNDLFHRKAFSWTRVFEDLEHVMPPRLHVVSIHPELTAANQLEIKLIVGGDSHEHALELIKKMEESKRFQDTQINQETRNKLGSPGQQGDNVEFDISALYVPAPAGSDQREPD